MQRTLTEMFKAGDKRKNNDDDREAEPDQLSDENNNEVELEEHDESIAAPAAKVPKIKKKKFQQKWLGEFSWLEYRDEQM